MLRRIAKDLLKDVAELKLVFVTGDVADMMCRHHIRHVQERVRGVAERLFFIEVDNPVRACKHARQQNHSVGAIRLTRVAAFTIEIVPQLVKTKREHRIGRAKVA